MYKLRNCLSILTLAFVPFYADASFLQRLLHRITGRKTAEESAIKIGVINQKETPITNAVSLWEQEVVENGGIMVGDTLYPVKVFIEDIDVDADEAIAATTKLIDEHEVHAIVGPDYSSVAIPAGEVANDKSTTLISGLSSNPETTKDRPWVFRASFIDPFQGAELAQFAVKEFENYTKAGIMFDGEDAYPTGLATYFKQEYEKLKGEEAVVSVTSFYGNTTDFKPFVTEMIDAGAEFMFLPQYSEQIPDILTQAEEAGWTGPVIGGDGWHDNSLPTTCGDVCNVTYFGTQFFAEDATGAALDFVEAFNGTYAELPDSAQALNYDSIRLVEDSIKRCGNLTGELEADRACIRDAMAETENFLGAGQNITFDENGDPQKCAVIIKILNEEFISHDVVCPPKTEIDDGSNVTATERGEGAA